MNIISISHYQYFSCLLSPSSLLCTPLLFSPPLWLMNVVTFVVRGRSSWHDHSDCSFALVVNRRRRKIDSSWPLEVVLRNSSPNCSWILVYRISVDDETNTKFFEILVAKFENRFDRTHSSDHQLFRSSPLQIRQSDVVNRCTKWVLFSLRSYTAGLTALLWDQKSEWVLHHQYQAAPTGLSLRFLNSTLNTWSHPRKIHQALPLPSRGHKLTCLKYASPPPFDERMRFV